MNLPGTFIVLVEILGPDTVVVETEPGFVTVLVLPASVVVEIEPGSVTVLVLPATVVVNVKPG
jgi:hypothetical protein